MKMKNTKPRWRIVIGIVALIIVVIIIATTIFLKMTFFKTFPELNGTPEIGKWYQITPANTISSDGSEWHGIFRKGIENKVVVYFFGGGVSITEETLFYSGHLYDKSRDVWDLCMDKLDQV